jgi:transcriptional antiterminator NusG
MEETNNNTAIENTPVVPAVEAAAEVAEEQLSSLTGNWYILHVFSGYENKVLIALESKIKEAKWQDKVFKVLIPEEDVIEVKNNKRVEKRKKMFPGYVFINMEQNDDIWYQIRKIPGVARFVGADFPEPVPEKEVMRILRQTGEKIKKVEIDFEINESVKVISGPFRGYVGEIKEIFPERGKVKVMISIFGRSTPMELDFNQIEKNL